MKPKVTLSRTIKIELQGKTLDLTFEEAEELVKQLNTLLGLDKLPTLPKVIRSPLPKTQEDSPRPLPPQPAWPPLQHIGPRPYPNYPPHPWSPPIICYLGTP